MAVVNSEVEFMQASQDQIKDHADPSQLTRVPLSIFDEIKKTSDKRKKSELEGKLKLLTGHGFKLGAAVDGVDSFFDAIAQRLKELRKKGVVKSDEDFNVKSLREDCANCTKKKYENEIIDNAKIGGYFVPRKSGEEDGHPNKKGTFKKYQESIKKTAEEGGICGRPEIEGKIISDKHKVEIKVIKFGEIFKCGKGNDVYIVNDNNHFIPLLGGIGGHTKESVPVPREEIYGKPSVSSTKLVNECSTSDPCSESVTTKQRLKTRKAKEKDNRIVESDGGDDHEDSIKDPDYTPSTSYSDSESSKLKGRGGTTHKGSSSSTRKRKRNPSNSESSQEQGSSSKKLHIEGDNANTHARTFNQEDQMEIDSGISAGEKERAEGEGALHSKNQGEPSSQDHDSTAIPSYPSSSASELSREDNTADVEMLSDSSESNIAPILPSSSAEEENEPDIKLEDLDEYLKKEVGIDINAKEWIREHPEQAKINKSELIIRLAYELCLAKNTEYDPKNEAEKNERGNNKHKSFDTKRVFAILKILNEVMERSDRKTFVEFVCQKGNDKLLEMICQQEKKEVKHCSTGQQYPWPGNFTGYDKLIDLLQYVIDQQCSKEVVRCIAEKVFGTYHNVYNGKDYLEFRQIQYMEKELGQENIEDCLKKAIKLGYRDTVLVMLGGDIYHCIRLMKNERFKGEEKFSEAYDMVKGAVADVISSWVEDEEKKESFKDEMRGLLDEGIERDIEKMSKKDLLDEFEERELKLPERKSHVTKKGLREVLKKEGVEVTNLKLRKDVVGSLISVLFFNYQDQVMAGGKFTLKTTKQDESRKKEKRDQLNEKIDDEGYKKEMVIELIKKLNSSTHMDNAWFFREVLARVVNGNFEKLKAVCAAICKKPMEKLLKGEEVHENVVDALELFGVETSSSKIITLEVRNNYSESSIGAQFGEYIKKLAESIKGDEAFFEKEAADALNSIRSGKVPAFSGLSRRVIHDLKDKKRKGVIKDNEKEELKNKVSEVMRQIKEGITTLADRYVRSKTDTKDIFYHFELINDELTKKERKEIVEFVCQKGNDKLLEMICQQERKEVKHCGIDHQYAWPGNFTGYGKLTDLLQYVIKQKCSKEVVRCIAEKVFGTHHNVCNGKDYLGSRQIQYMEKELGQENIEDCLKKAIKLGYRDTVLVMLGGDIYHCIRLMKNERFKGEEKFREAYDMVKGAVADVISSWVDDKEKRESFNSEIKGLLDEGIEMDINKMSKIDLLNEFEERELKLPKWKSYITEKELKKELRKKGVKVTNLKLRKDVVGSLILALFFNHQDQVMAGGKFTLDTTSRDESRKKEKCDQLNEKIDDEGYKKEMIIKLIKKLNSSTHTDNAWFFREVLARIMNGDFEKLKAVCAAICKGPMEELLKGKEVHENVVDALELFGVDPSVLNKSEHVVPSMQNVENLLPAPGSNSGFVTPNRDTDKSLNNSKPCSGSGCLTTVEPEGACRSIAIETGTDGSNKENRASEHEEADNSTGRKAVQNIACSKVLRNPLVDRLTDNTGPAVSTPKDGSNPLFPSFSRVSNIPKENNESFMQNNSGQAENSMYHEGDGSRRQSKKVGLTSGGCMFKNLAYDPEQIARKQKEIARTSVGLSRIDRIGSPLPTIEELLGISQVMHREEILDDVVFKFSELSYKGLLDSNSPGQQREMYALFANNYQFKKYEAAIAKLEKGNWQSAEEILASIKQPTAPIIYLCTVVAFKRLIDKYNIYSGDIDNSSLSLGEVKKIIEEETSNIRLALEYLKGVVEFVEPAGSFLRGMMARLNIGACRGIMEGIGWQEKLKHVISMAKSTGFLSSIDNNILNNINNGKEMISEKCGLGMERKPKYVIKMAKYSLYQFALDMLEESRSSSMSMDLLKFLSESDFSEAQYCYGALLLKTDPITRDRVGKAVDYLRKAALKEHRVAKLLLGILPFNNNIRVELLRDEIDDCLCKLEGCIEGDNELYAAYREAVDSAAVFLAEEYYYGQLKHFTEDGKEMAQKILEKRGLEEEWEKLKCKKIQRQDKDVSISESIRKTIELLDEEILNRTQDKFHEGKNIIDGLHSIRRLLVESEKSSSLMTKLQQQEEISKTSKLSYKDLEPLNSYRDLCSTLKARHGKLDSCKRDSTIVDEGLDCTVRTLTAISERFQGQSFGVTEGLIDRLTEAISCCKISKSEYPSVCTPPRNKGGFIPPRTSSIGKFAKSDSDLNCEESMLPCADKNARKVGKGGHVEDNSSSGIGTSGSRSSLVGGPASNIDGIQTPEQHSSSQLQQVL